MDPSTSSSSWSRFGRGLASVLGHYSPPPWLRWAGRSVIRPVRRRPIVTLSILTVMAASGAGVWKWRQWEEAHRPRPKVDEFIALRNLVVTAADPNLTPINKKGEAEPTALIVTFSDSAAPIARRHGAHGGIRQFLNDRGGCGGDRPAGRWRVEMGERPPVGLSAEGAMAGGAEVFGAHRRGGTRGAHAARPEEFRSAIPVGASDCHPGEG